MTSEGSDFVIDVPSPLGVRVECSAEYWEKIVGIKHPPMRGRDGDVRLTLTDPEEVRRSVGDREVVLFHRQFPPRWMTAVVKLTPDRGYLITAYPADKVKSGEVLWIK